MLVPILFALLALFIPLWILRSYKALFNTMVFLVILCHLGGVCFMHIRLVKKTGSTVVFDVHDDTVKYYRRAMKFADARPFSITREDALEMTEGSPHYGYEYLLATFWTITDHPMLAMRFFKVMLYFVGLSCLVRVWRTDYGESLAVGAFFFLGVVFTPVSYYFYRNLKDGVLLGLFMLIMAQMDTLLRPSEMRLTLLSPKKTFWGWIIVLGLLYLFSTIRLYAAAMIILALCMQILLTTERLGAKTRVFLLLGMVMVVCYAFYSGAVGKMMEQSSRAVRAFTGKGILQAFLSPLPWGTIRYFEPLSMPFYWLYWALLPYALYAMLRHLKSNITWHLFVYLMVLYIVGVAIGDPPRKRLIVFPILVMWVIKHLFYTRCQRFYEEQDSCEPCVSDQYVHQH